MKYFTKNRIFIITLLILLPIFIELFMFGKIVIEKATFIRISFIYGVYLLVIIYKIIKKYKDKVKKVLEFVIDKRYIIALFLLVILVVGKINFSSLDEWKPYIGETELKNTVVGYSRSIRADEWLVQTPIMLAQANRKDGYKIYNENIGQGNINMLMTPAIVEDIVTISRPFTWGFLLFDAERGYSFYWALKYIALIMVSIELALKITNRDKLLGLVGGLMLGLAPAMLWWMSTSVTEAYIFGAAVIVMFSYYMEHLDWKLWKKLLIGLGMIVCLPAFVFTIYPAYIVPFGFLMAIFIINDFIKHRKELKVKDYVIMGATILFCLGIIARFVLLAWDGIYKILHTVYPGQRQVNGGDCTVQDLFSYLVNIFLPYTSENINSSEASTYIYPFIGLIVMLFANLKRIVKDKKNKERGLILALVILFIIFIVWEYIGFPGFLSKITLLYFSPGRRTNIVLALIGAMLALMIMKSVDDGEGKKIETSKAIAISLISIIVAYIGIKCLNYSEFFTPFKKEIVAVMIFFMTYFFLRANKDAWCYTMCIVSIIAGITVNPVVKGVSLLYDTEIAQEIQKIREEDKDAIWIGNNATGQYLIANGVTSISGVNMYPNFEWLNKIDPEKKYDEVYNRYAHINVVLDDKTEFKLASTDAYEAHLTYKNLKDLGVKYYYINSEISDDIKKSFKLEPKYEDKEKNQYIYEIK